MLGTTTNGGPQSPLPLSPEERERQYSPSSCIGGDYSPFLRSYAELSAAALKSGRAERRELRYGDKASNMLDLFVPTVDHAVEVLPPLLVFIHGGFWQELSKESSLFAAPACLDAGFAFAAVDYTLAPSASVLDIALECRLAVRWLHSQGPVLGFDPGSIIVAGSSAGAHLAAMVCVRDWVADGDLPEGLPAGAVLVSGIFDLAPLLDTTVNNALSLTQQTAAAVSPQHLSLGRFPPAVVCWGEVETDEFKRQSIDFANAIGCAGQQKPTCFEVPGRNHFDVILDLAQPGNLLGDATVRLLNEAAESAAREA